jgi:hypothetical protein
MDVRLWWGDREESRGPFMTCASIRLQAGKKDNGAYMRYKDKANIRTHIILSERPKIK